MPFAGGIGCGDAHFFRQRAELSLNIPAETSCPVSNLFPVWICLAGFMLLFLTYFLSDKYRIHWLYGVSVFLCCFGLGAGMTEEYLHRTDFPFSDEAAVYPDRAVFEHTDKGRFRMFDMVSGSEEIRKRFSQRNRWEDVRDYWYKDAEDFRRLSKKYYLYK